MVSASETFVTLLIISKLDSYTALITGTNVVNSLDIGYYYPNYP